MPESALLCYLINRPMLADRVASWSRELGIPLIVGALHWDNAPKGSSSEYYVYNTAYYLDPATARFSPYYKIKLVPFSETLPFKGVFPILSRVNLGQADFRSGRDFTVFSIGNTIKAGPFICYEIIYPGFVRERVKRGATCLSTSPTTAGSAKARARSSTPPWRGCAASRTGFRSRAPRTRE